MVYDTEDEGVEPGEHDQSELQLECRIGPVHERVGHEELDSSCEIDEEADDHERQKGERRPHRNAADETQQSEIDDQQSAHHEAQADEVKRLPHGEHPAALAHGGAERQLLDPVKNLSLGHVMPISRHLTAEAGAWC